MRTPLVPPSFRILLGLAPLAFIAVMASCRESEQAFSVDDQGDALTCGGRRLLCGIRGPAGLGGGSGAYYPEIACAPSNGQSFGTSSVRGSFDGSFAEGDLRRIAYPDLNGDGSADVCLRSATGLKCAGPSVFTTTASQWDTTFSDANGWSSPQYGGTIQYADIDGDGDDDVCGRASGGIYCGLSTTLVFASPTLWSTNFIDAYGWSAPSYYETLQLADLNADGKADICGRGYGGMYCALSTGSGFGALSLWSNGPSTPNGWDVASRYKTLKLVDVNGDRKPDLCGRGTSGILCGLSTGTSFGAMTLWSNAFSDLNGWSASSSLYESITYADLNGDSISDVCGRSDSGIYCAISQKTTFGPIALWSTDFQGVGWNVPGALRLADIDNDRKADICLPSTPSPALGNIHCARSTGAAFVNPALWSTGWATSRPTTIKLPKGGTNTCL